MRRLYFLVIPVFALLTGPLACSKSAAAPQVESKSETKSTNPDGSRVTTTTEGKRVGSTEAVTTETREGGNGRSGKTQRETVVGTVTDYGPGKRLVILTGDGKKHDWDLTDKKTTASVDPRITVGSKVRLDTTLDDSGHRSLEAVPVSSR